MRISLVPSLAVRRRLAAAAVGWLLCASPAATGVPDLARFAARDTRVFLQVDDGRGFLRRAANTDLARALGPERGRLALAAFPVPEFFLPPVLRLSAARLLHRSEGRFAVAVSGAVLEGGKARPDILFLADGAPFEPLFGELLASSLGDAASFDARRLEALGFAPSPDARPEVSPHDGVPVVRFRLSDGTDIALAVRDGVLFGARDEETLAAALDRAVGKQRGSLADEPWFRLARRRLGGAPGSFSVFAHLRLLERDRPLLERADPLAVSWLDLLRGIDAIALRVRGEGDVFRLRALVAADPAQALDGTKRLGDLALADLPTIAVLALSTDAAGVATILRAANRWLGGVRDPIYLRRRFEDAFNSEERGRWKDALGGGCLLAVLRPEGGGAFPGAFAALELRNPPLAGRLLEAAAARGDVVTAHEESSGRRYFSADVGLNFYLSRPGVALVGDRLLLASNVPLLRDLLVRLENPRPDRDRFLEPFDRLDVDPREPLLGFLHCDGARAAPWFSLLELTFPLSETRAGSAPPRRGRFARLAEELRDPDVEEALHGLLLVARPAPGGVEIDVVGP